MSDNKKYYYLKLKDNYFDHDSMIVLESMEDGYLYSNILLKLYLRSLKDSGRLMFNDRIPYNSTILAKVVRHNVGVVEKALQIFTDLGLIEILDNGAIYMMDIQNFIGQSSSEGDRKRIHRSRVDAEKMISGQMSGQMSDKRPPEKEIEIDIKIEKEIELQLQQKSDVVDVFNLYQSEIGILSPIISDRLNDWVNTSGEELVAYAIELAVAANVRRLAYIEAVLKAWQDRSITTVADAKAIDINRNKPKQVSQKPKVETVQNVQNQVSEDDYLAILRKHGLEVSNA